MRKIRFRAFGNFVVFFHVSRQKVPQKGEGGEPIVVHLNDLIEWNIFCRTMCGLNAIHTAQYAIENLPMLACVR